MTDEVYYRFDATSWGDTISIFASKIPVVSHTPCGVWLGYYGHKDHFVLNGSGKRYAYATIEDAWYSYQRRKARQLGFIKAQHDHVAKIVETIQGKTYAELKDSSGEIRIEPEPEFFLVSA